jgi:hypothetical protein
MNLVRISFALALAACGSNVPDPSSPEDPETLHAAEFREAVADLENGLPYDGCTWLVTIGEKGYAPSAASRAVIEGKTTNIGHTSARIRYRLTGRDGSVECGWNTRQTLPEIEIKSVSAP